MSINFNDLPCDIKHMIFSINRRDAHLKQIQNYRPKYWPYCFHNRQCYESWLEDNPGHVSSSRMDQFNNLRPEGYVYDEKFYTTFNIYNFDTTGIIGYAIAFRVQMDKLKYKLTRKQISTYASDNDTDSDDDY